MLREPDIQKNNYDHSTLFNELLNNLESIKKLTNFYSRIKELYSDELISCMFKRYIMLCKNSTIENIDDLSNLLEWFIEFKEKSPDVVYGYNSEKELKVGYLNTMNNHGYKLIRTDEELLKRLKKIS